MSNQNSSYPNNISNVLSNEELSGVPELVLEHALDTIFSQPAIDDDDDENSERGDNGGGDGSSNNTARDEPNIIHGTQDVHRFGKFVGQYTKPKPNIGILYALMSVKVLAENMVVGVILDLTLQKIQKHYKHQDESLAQREFAKFQSVTSVIQGLLGISLCSKYGHLSDNHGRVFVLKICGIFTIVGSLANIYIYKDSSSYEFYSFVFCYCVEALNAGTMSMVAIGNSYVTDIVSEDDRMVYISYFMSIMYATIGIGPLIGSFLVKTFHGHGIKTLYIALFLNILYSLGLQFLLAESRTVTERRESQSSYNQEAIRKNLLKREALSSQETSIWSKIYHLSKIDLILDLFKPLKTLWIPKTSTGSLIPRINVLILLIIEMLVAGSVEGSIQAIITYAMFRYDWASVEIGYYYSITGVGRALVLLIAVPKLVSFLRKRHYVLLGDSIDKIDMISLSLFLFFVIVAFASMIAYESNDIGVYLNAIFISLSAFALPTIQNAIVKYGSKKSIGQVFAALAVLRHLVQLVTPPLFLQLYAATGNTWPTLFLYIPLFLALVSAVLLKFVKIVEDHAMLRRASEVSLLGFSQEDCTPKTIVSEIGGIKEQQQILIKQKNSKPKNIPIESTPLLSKTIGGGGGGSNSIKNSYRTLRNSYATQSHTPMSSNNSLDRTKTNSSGSLLNSNN